MTDVPIPDPNIEDLTDSFLGDVSTNGDVTRVDPAFGPVQTVDPSSSNETFIPDEEFTTGFEGATATIGDGSCDVCGAPTFRPPGLTKTGRKKRAPKYCDLHAPKSHVSRERPEFIGVESQLQRVQEELADDIRLAGTLIGPLFPVSGFYIFTQADPFVTAVLKLAKNNTRVLRVLHRAAQVAPIYVVAETVAGTAVAVQVDLRKVDPHGPAARRLGVERAYTSVYPEDTSTDTNTVVNNGFSQAPRYATR